MGLWVWNPPDDHHHFSMDLSLWDSPHFSASQHDNEDDSFSLGYYSRDVIEEEALNEKYCLQALNIMNGNTQEDVHYPDEHNILMQNIKNGNIQQQQQQPQSLDNNNIECCCGPTTPKTNKRKMELQVDTSPTPTKVMKMKTRDSLAFKEIEMKLERQRQTFQTMHISMEPQISTQNLNDHQIRVGIATSNIGQKPIQELTVVHLKAICKKLNMKGYTTLCKADLIKLLEQRAPHLF